MTVQDNGSRDQYTATSGQTVFPYTFEVFQKGDIAVAINGVLKSEGTHYSLSGVGTDVGGNVTLTTGASAGDVVTIYRDMELNRLNDYQQSGDFLASEVNSDYDRLWLAIQQLKTQSNLSIRGSLTDESLTSINTLLPSAAGRAGKYLAFDNNGIPRYPLIPDDIESLTNVKAYGAAGDGITDDTAAIQSALDSGQAFIYFPEGVYIISSSITASNKIALIGRGLIKENTLLTNTLILGADNICVDGLRFESVETQITWAAATTGERTTRKSFIYAANRTGLKLYNLEFTGKRQGIYLQTCTRCIVNTFKHFGMLGPATQPFDATAGQTAFSFSFPIYNVSNLSVSVNGTFLANGVGYNVSTIPTDSGGTVTLTSPASLNDRVVVRAELNDNFVTSFQADAGGEHVVLNGQGYETGSVVLFGFDSSQNSVYNTIGENIHDNGIYNSSGNASVFIGGNFNNTFGSGIKVRGFGSTVKGFVIRNTNLGVTITGNGDPDGSGANGFGHVVEGNFIASYNQIGIECGEQDGYFPRDCIITGNTLEAGKAPRAGSFCGIRARGVRGIHVTNNIVRSFITEYAMFIAGPSSAPAQNFVVANNTVSDGEDGFQFQYLENSIIQGNMGSDLSTRFMEMRFVNDCFITGNMDKTKAIDIRSDFSCTGNTATNNEVLATFGDKTLNKIQNGTLSYDFGFFTPAYAEDGTAIAGITYGIQQGWYTRIGKMVHVQARIRTSVMPTGVTGNITISGLPFTSSDAGTGSYSAISLGRVQEWATNSNPTNAWIARNTSEIILSIRNETVAPDDVNAPTVPLVGANIKTGTGDYNEIMFGGTYFIDET